MDRITILEQQFTVLSKEITEVLTEVQASLQGFARSTSMALTVIIQRLEELERRTGILPPSVPPSIPEPTPEGGKEL